MIVLAHRGLRRHGPENSLPGMRGVALAAASGLALGVELDVRRMADDTLITAHDDTLWKGPVEKTGYTWADNWYECAQQLLGELCPPRLEDVLEVLVDDVPVIDLDIKERGYTQAAIAAASIVRPDRLMVSSHIPEVIREARALLPDGAKTGMSIGEHWHRGTDGVVQLVVDVQADFAFTHQGLVTQELVDRVHAIGKQLGVYTVNDQATLHRMIDMGVDFPCTDRPEMAIKELLPPEAATA